MNLFAQIISAISNPIVVSAPIFYALIFKTSGNMLYSLQWTFASFLFAATVALFIFYGVRQGFFSDLDITKQKERKTVFIFTSFIAFIYLILVFILNCPKVLLVALGGLLLGLALASLINRKIKASLHLAVFSSFTMVLGILYGGIFWIALLLAPVVAWSRIKLKRHFLSETIVGAGLGVFLVILVYFVVKYFA